MNKKQKQRRNRNRAQKRSKSLHFERLETRRLLAADLNETLLMVDPPSDGNDLGEIHSAEVGDSVHHRDHREGGRNPVDPLDVSGDYVISPLDALLSVNDLNEHGARSLDQISPGGQDDPLPYLDVNDDNIISPSDVLSVVNALNDPDSLTAGFLSELHSRLDGGNGARSEVSYEVQREHGRIHRAFHREMEGLPPMATCTGSGKAWSGPG